MITGSIKTYKETPKTFSYQGWNGEDGYYNTMPHYSMQGDLLKEMLLEATQLGLVIGAKVQRKIPHHSQTVGTIIAIHETFGLAWNYTTGVLEPIKVQWETHGIRGQQTFDYAPDELSLITDELTPPEKVQNEDFNNFHFAC